MDIDVVDIRGLNVSKTIEGIAILPSFLFVRSASKTSRDRCKEDVIKDEHLCARYSGQTIHISPRDEHANSIDLGVLPEGTVVREVYCDGSVQFQIGGTCYHAYTAPQNQLF